MSLSGLTPFWVLRSLMTHSVCGLNLCRRADAGGGLTEEKAPCGLSCLIMEPSVLFGKRLRAPLSQVVMRLWIIYERDVKVHLEDYVF